MFDWMKSQKWVLPEKKYVLQNIISDNFTDCEKQEEKKVINNIDELVFFGRLEVRKGIRIFMQSLMMIHEAFLPKIITFLGGECDVNKQTIMAYLGWLKEKGRKVQVLCDKN